MKSAMTYAASLAVALLWTHGARAQDPNGQLMAGEEPLAADEEPRDLSAIADAVEVTIAAGYAQAFGQVSTGLPNLTDIGLAGWSVQLGVGYRLTPRLALGVYGGGAISKQTELEATNLYSALSGLKVDWHFLPAGHEVDPWVSLGTGWRGYWIEQEHGAMSLQGFDLAKLQAGFDYRAERRAAIGPVVGLDLSRFVWEAGPSAERYENTSHPRVNTFVFVGIVGRLDIPRDAQQRRRVASL